jgi:hypothetical protein
MTASPLLILLDPQDNVLVCGAPVSVGDDLWIDGDRVPAQQSLPIGHKVARRDLAVGDQVLRYGAPIGTVTAPTARGQHVHLHNLTSNYLASQARQARQAVASQKD